MIAFSKKASFGCRAGDRSSCLRGKGRALPGTLKALAPRPGPDHCVPAHVGNRHNGIIERGLNVSDSVLDDSTLFLLALLDVHMNTLHPFQMVTRLVPPN